MFWSGKFYGINTNLHLNCLGNEIYSRCCHEVNVNSCSNQHLCSILLNILHVTMLFILSRISTLEYYSKPFVCCCWLCFYNLHIFFITKKEDPFLLPNLKKKMNIQNVSFSDLVLHYQRNLLNYLALNGTPFHKIIKEKYKINTVTR